MFLRSLVLTALLLSGAACHGQSNVYPLSIYSGGVTHHGQLLVGSPPCRYGFDESSLWKDRSGLVMTDVWGKGSPSERGGTHHRYFRFYLGWFCCEMEVPVNGPPYRQSLLVRNLTWDTNVIRIGNGNSGRDGVGDNWPITWGDDDNLYTSYGDGPGFYRSPKPYLTLGFARISGDPPTLTAEDILSDADTPAGGGRNGIKSSGLLMVDSVLWMFVRNYRVDGDYRHARLAWSTDHAKTWKWADWHFSDTFGCPEFVQFGPNYAGARDEFVYVVSPDINDAYEFSPHVVLARVPKARLAERKAYSFFCGLDAGGQPTWTPEIQQRKPAFSQFRGNQRISLTFNAALRRYFLTASHRVGSGTHNGSLGVFEAPEPWGPWSVVYFDDYWSGTDPTYHHKFPTKWMSPDGKTMWLLYSGLGAHNYAFCLRKATLHSL